MHVTRSRAARVRSRARAGKKRAKKRSKKLTSCTCPSLSTGCFTIIALHLFFVYRSVCGCVVVVCLVGGLRRAEAQGQRGRQTETDTGRAAAADNRQPHRQTDSSHVGR